METNIKDYLHLYLGCKCVVAMKQTQKCVCISTMTLELMLSPFDLTPILRPLSDMTEQELIEVIQLSVPDDLEDHPTADDYDLEIFYNDGGNLVDRDVAIGATYSCICYEGSVAIRKCGTIHFFNDEGEFEKVYNIPRVYAFLLSKQFDMFGLIEAGLAIDKTTLK